MTRFLLVIALLGCGRVAVKPLAGDAGDAGDAADAADAEDSPPPWELVQTIESRRPARTQSLIMDPLGAQHLVVVAIQVPDGGSITGITDASNCNAYTAIPTARSSNAGAGDALQMFYAKNSCAGASTISIDATTAVTAVVWEVSGIRTDDPFDKASTLNDQPETATPVGPTIETSTRGEFVVSVAIVANTVAGIHPGNKFTNDHLANGNAWAHLTDSSAPADVYQAQWDPLPPPELPPGSYCASAAAFRVAPAPATPRLDPAQADAPAAQ
jgi:hypothetical protein